MLINVTPWSHTKKLPYEIVYVRKLNLPIDAALQLQSTQMTTIGDYVQELLAMW